MEHKRELQGDMKLSKHTDNHTLCSAGLPPGHASTATPPPPRGEARDEMGAFPMIDSCPK